MLDQIPDLQQIQAQMIYHRGARMASVADFSALLPAFLVSFVFGSACFHFPPFANLPFFIVWFVIFQVARTVKRNDQFSNTDLLMTEDGHVLAV